MSVWPPKEVEWFAELVKGEALPGDAQFEFEYDDGWAVTSVALDVGDPSVIRLIIERLDDGRAVLVLRCHFAEISGPYRSTTDAFDTTFTELAGAVGLEAVQHKETLDLWPGMNVHTLVGDGE